LTLNFSPLVTDISPLANLSSLQNLELWGANPATLEPLSVLPNLRYLSVSNLTTALPSLYALTGLQDLALRNSPQVDLSQIAQMSNLTSLLIHGNELSDVSVLQSMSALQALYIGFNPQISDVSFIANMPSLFYLDLAFLVNADLSHNCIAFPVRVDWITGSCSAQQPTG